MKHLIFAVSLILASTPVFADDLIMTCDYFGKDISCKFETKKYLFGVRRYNVYERRGGEWSEWCQKKWDKLEIKDEYAICDQGFLFLPDGTEKDFCVDKDFNPGSCNHTLDFISKKYFFEVKYENKPKEEWSANCR